MQKDGYRLAFIEDNNKVVAVAGYRIYTNLFMGKHLYVDDLVTSSKSRSQGYGAELVTWLKMEAKRENCSYFDLDSGTQRGDAHRFYFNQGLTIASYHFSEKLVS
jgi:GNAT superfamily N-acetyltransferase